VKIDKPYVFEGPNGKCTLADLFQGRSQLAVYHFMLTPGSHHVCKGCSFVADHFDAEFKYHAPEHRLPAATRKSMLLLFARAAALRLQALHDPTGPYQFD